MSFEAKGQMSSVRSPLLIDLYQLSMIQAYLEHAENDIAVFEFFVRRIPASRGFLMAAGLEQALDFLQQLHFSADDLEWIDSTRRFSNSVLDYLAKVRFNGDVHAMPEGTVFFPDEPILRVTAPLPIAQLVETRLINILHFQTLIASKAARMVLAAPSKQLVDFGLRRAHGADAGLLAARASYIAGFAGTATLLANRRFGIPVFGTMAHSYIQAHDDEITAFENFARARPEGLTLLIDTYDTVAAAHKVVTLAPRLKSLGIEIRAVRLDSGDLGALASAVRQVLDQGGLPQVQIFASGGLDETLIDGLVRSGAPIDGFGVGTALTTSSDLPALDCAYKLQEYAGTARRKLAAGKATWPGRKQVWRQYGADERMAGDVLTIDGDSQPGTPLLQLVLQGGVRVGSPGPSLQTIRSQAAQELERLPDGLRRLETKESYRVHVAAALTRLTADVDRRIASQQMRAT
jgi:nicotinate phosphoribosyltransferase